MDNVDATMLAGVCRPQPRLCDKTIHYITRLYIETHSNRTLQREVKMRRKLRGPTHELYRLCAAGVHQSSRRIADPEGDCVTDARHNQQTN